MLIGLGGLMCLYSIEWYARQNCPQSFVSFVDIHSNCKIISILEFWWFKESALVDYLLPRSFTCGMGKGLSTESQSDFTLNQIKIDL